MYGRSVATATESRFVTALEIAEKTTPKCVILSTKRRKAVIVSAEMTLSSFVQDRSSACRKRGWIAFSATRWEKESRLRRPSFAIVFGLEPSDRTRGASPIGRSRRRSLKADPPAHSDFQRFINHVISSGAGIRGSARGPWRTGGKILRCRGDYRRIPSSLERRSTRGDRLHLLQLNWLGSNQSLGDQIRAKHLGQQNQETFGQSL